MVMLLVGLSLMGSGELTVVRSVRNAHRIIVVEGGRLIESGTHTELKLKGGMYCKLLAMQ